MHVSITSLVNVLREINSAALRWAWVLKPLFCHLTSQCFSARIKASPRSTPNAVRANMGRDREERYDLWLSWARHILLGAAGGAAARDWQTHLCLHSLHRDRKSHRVSSGLNREPLSCGQNAAKHTLFYYRVINGCGKKTGRLSYTWTYTWKMVSIGCNNIFWLQCSKQRMVQFCCSKSTGYQ